MKTLMIHPFILGQRKDDDGIKRFLPFWLQYDDGEKTSGKHRRAGSLSEWKSLDSVKVQQGDVEYVIPLAFANTGKGGTERVSVPFGRGTLFGSFPTREMNAELLVKSLVMVEK